MLARMLLATAALVAAWSLSVAALETTPGSPGELKIVARGEAMQLGMTEAFLHPFTEVSKIDAVGGSWDGGLETLRSQLKAPDNTWDLILVDADELATGCGEGLFEKLDWSAIGGKDHYQQQGVSECGVGGLVSNLVLAWDRDKFGATPTWADFWDVAKYPGKRGLAKGVRGNMEIALLADGVAQADIYKTLASTDGVDRAFRKLDQLKPYIVWWPTAAEAARILGSGDVLMTSAPSGVIATASRQDTRSFGIQWNGSLYELLSWTIAKGSPNLRSAQQFLYFTGMPAVEARLLRQSGQLGVAKGVNDSLPPELQAISPTIPANTAGALRADAGFWHDNEAKLRQRFDAWLGR
jgi:putative spermidine/putrescine transport system substrate-binding protein